MHFRPQRQQIDQIVNADSSITEYVSRFFRTPFILCHHMMHLVMPRGCRINAMVP